MPLDITVPIPLGPTVAFVVRLMPPHVEFGCPVQRAKTADESYWHIPVKIFPRIFKRIGFATLSPCRVYMDLYSGGAIKNKIQLGWGDMYFEDPRREEVLQKDRTLLIPIVWRSGRKEDTNAYIADLPLLRDGSSENAIPGDRQKHKFKLRVKRGPQEWVSPHLYFIRVPKEPGNGQFGVEIEFEGEGTQGA